MPAAGRPPVLFPGHARESGSFRGFDVLCGDQAKVLILTRRFAMELGCRGVTVNAVALGWIVTEMARAGHSEEEFQVRAFAA